MFPFEDAIMYKLIIFIKTSNHKRDLIRASRDYTFEFTTFPVVNELFSAFHLYFHSLTFCHEAVYCYFSRANWVFFICAWINGRVNSREADDLRRRRTH